MKAKWLLALPGAVLAVGIGLIACGDGGAKGGEAHRHGNEIWEKEASLSDMPSFLDNYSARTRHLYSVVGEYADIMKRINCYCGCMEYEDDPHDSLYRCYVASLDESGVTWTDHSGTCGICTEELVMVEQLAKQGQTVEQIIQAIDDNFKPSV